MKQFLRKFAEVEKISLDNYRFYVVIDYGSLLGLLIHIFLIFLFLRLGASDLGYYNILSAFTYLVIFLINRRRFHGMASMLGIVEITIHSLLAVRTLGWESGFQYYMLALTPFLFLVPGWSSRFKVLITAILYFAYSTLMVLFRAGSPVIALDAYTLGVINAANIGVLFVVTGGLAHYYNWASQASERRLKSANQRLEVLATRDDLTDLINRRAMISRIENEVYRYQCGAQQFALILADIDGFKAFNDRYGHECGDYVLAQVAGLLRGALRKQDVVARWGGEEFLLLLPDTDLEAGKRVAEKLRRCISDAGLAYKGKPIAITMTFGVSRYIEAMEIDRLIGEADQAMYQGKERGRNCVVISGTQPSPLI